MSNIDYQEKYVLFIDILGFSEMVMNSAEDSEVFTNLHRTLMHAKEFAAHIKSQDLANKGDIEISIFSDCIAISTVNSPAGLGYIFALSSMIYCDFFHHGVMARGGLSKGKIYHSQGVIFGEGLINAYAIENKTAIYPRIVIDDKVTMELQKLADSSNRNELINFEDFDGMQCLHVLHPRAVKNDPRTPNLLESGLYMENGRKAVRKSLTSGNLSIRAKNLWMQKYYNSNAEELGLERI